MRSLEYPVMSHSAASVSFFRWSRLLGALVLPLLLGQCSLPSSTGDAGIQDEGASLALNSESDAARFLAGMSGGGSARLAKLRQTPEWKSHQQRMEQLFTFYHKGHLPPIRAWRGETDATSPGVLFYPFGGPDFLFADAFFPGASNLVLVGLEGASPMPDLNALSDAEIFAGLRGITTSIDTVLGAGYFVTKEMRGDLESTRFRGALPLMLVFIARTGHSISSVESTQVAGAPGFVVRCPGKSVYFFQKDLSNGGVGSDKRLPNFVSSLGTPVTFIKSASYLLHNSGFSAIRQEIMNRSRVIVEDPSGIPFHDLKEAGWNISLYGNYTHPLDVFASNHQTDLAEAYRSGAYPVKPVSFGYGYLRNPATTSIIVARK